MRNLKRIRTVFLSLALVLSLCIPAYAAMEDTGFSDVAADAWYTEFVVYCRDNGLMAGTSATTFSPDVSTTRGLSRLAGTPAVSGTDSYTDTQSGAWYSDAVLWASQNGVVSGYGNGLFGTNDPLTREQMATILYRYAQEKQYDVSGRNDLSAFADAARVSAYAKEAMQWAVDAGLISGIGDNLVPQNGANRAQVATMLMRFAENVNQ